MSDLKNFSFFLKFKFYQLAKFHILASLFLFTKNGMRALHPLSSFLVKMMFFDFVFKGQGSFYLFPPYHFSLHSFRYWSTFFWKHNTSSTSSNLLFLLTQNVIFLCTCKSVISTLQCLTIDNFYHLPFFLLNVKIVYSTDIFSFYL